MQQRRRQRTRCLPPKFMKQRSSKQTTSRNNNRPKPVAPPSRACRRMILSLYCWLLFMPLCHVKGARGHRS